MKDGMTLLAAFAAGALAGAAAGLLMAPEKGEDQRKKIAEAIQKSGAKLNKEELKKAVDNVVDSLKNSVDTIKDTAKKYTGTLTEDELDVE